MPNLKSQIRQNSNTAGTAMQCGVGANGGTNLTPGTRNCTYIMVQAQKNNAGVVTVGAVGVVGSAAGRTGIGLDPGECQPIECDSVDQLWLDVITNNDGITGLVYE